MSRGYAVYIRKLRKKSGFSQLQVAEKLNISRPSYIAIEQGKRELSLKEAGVLAEFFDVDVNDFLANKNRKKQEKYEQMFFAFLRNLTGDKKIPKTKLAKLLYLADFSWFYSTHKSMSGLSYRKIAHGPVPDYYFRLIEELEGDGKITIQPSGKALLISETRIGEKVNDNLLNVEEKKLIKKISKKWQDKDTKEIVDFAHSQLPYVFADKGAIIPYELITQEDPKHVF